MLKGSEEVSIHLKKKSSTVADGILQKWPQQYLFTSSRTIPEPCQFPPKGRVYFPYP